jgi:hypothetical protein
MNIDFPSSSKPRGVQVIVWLYRALNIVLIGSSGTGVGDGVGVGVASAGVGVGCGVGVGRGVGFGVGSLGFGKRTIRVYKSDTSEERISAPAYRRMYSSWPSGDHTGRNR